MLRTRIGFYCHRDWNRVFDVMKVGGPTNAKFRSIWKERAWERNWASVLLCELAQAHILLGLLHLCFRFMNLLVSQGFQVCVFACAHASPTLPSPCSCMHRLWECVCQCVYPCGRQGTTLFVANHTWHAKATRHAECNSRLERQLAWETSQLCSAQGAP